MTIEKQEFLAAKLHDIYPTDKNVCSWNEYDMRAVRFVIIPEIAKLQAELAELKTTNQHFYKKEWYAKVEAENKRLEDEIFKYNEELSDAQTENLRLREERDYFAEILHFGNQDGTMIAMIGKAKENKKQALNPTENKDG